MDHYFKSLIIHPFLFIISPIVFILSYVNEVPINYLVLPILLTSAIVLLLLVLLRWIFKSGTKAGIVLSFLLILLILYGYLHEKLFGVEIWGINVGSYATLLVPFSIVFFFGIYYLAKTKNKLNRATIICNVTSLGLILIVISSVGINGLVNSEIKHSEGLEVLSLPMGEQTDLPDIYYIILDEYAGSASLQKDFNFDNSNFYSALSERGFYVQSTSYSNYPYTMLSIPSSLNMQYLNFLGERLGVESTDTRPIIEILKNNLVMENLKSKGYHIVSFYAGTKAESSTQLVDEQLCGDEYAIYELMYLMTKFTPVSYFQPIQTHHDKKGEILCTFSEISRIKDRISKPIFVYAHMMIPHEPYVFDTDGNPVTFNPEITDQSTKERLYLEQLKFANKKTIEAVDAILAKSKNPPIIIIQSDHGERTGIDWDNPTKEMIRRGFNNLNAYYLPNDGKNALYDTITPVNSFRVIFNEYFNADFELLDDKSYWLKSDEMPYDLKDVTEILNEYR